MAIFHYCLFLKIYKLKNYENIASFNIGTGSVIHFFINKDTQFQIGGWGHIFGDQCSDIGLEINYNLFIKIYR